jgi:acetylornithine deacetylase
MNDKLINLVYKLCSINSLTYHEYNILLFVSDYLKSQNFIVEHIPVPGYQDRFNILAYFTNKPKWTTLFCTHIDTVAPYIAPKIKDNTLWGRGACDAKGIAASMIMAMLKEKALGHDDIALLLTIGEEDTSDGAKACGKLLAGRAKYIIIGEPTELKAASAQKGSLLFDISCEGQEAHSSLPHLGSSAIAKLVNILARLDRLDFPKSQNFGETLFNCGLINGGSARNVLAAHAHARCIMRLTVPSQDIIDMLLVELGDLGCLDILSKSEPFSYEVPAGFPTFVAGFGSDAPYLTEISQKLLLFGPGSLSLAHSQDEHISFDDLLESVDKYCLISNWARQN